MPQPPSRASSAATWPFLAVLAAAMALAGALAFVQDDAYISFRYAANLVAGHGLVWQPGEPVQGYTNFLWTLLIAAGLRAGLDPVAVATALGLAAYAVTLTATWRLGCAVMTRAAPGLPAAPGDRVWPLLPVGLVATNYSFAAYATGGLETQLQAALIAVSALVALHLPGSARPGPRLLLLSGLFTLAGLTRLDSAIAIVVIGGWVLLALARQRGPRALPGAALRLAGPGAAAFGLYALWCLETYGSILPNTFAVKAGSGARGTLMLGANYVYLFLVLYGLALPLIGSLLVFRRVYDCGFLRMVLVLSGLWIAYVIHAGGDFMEFRFMVPLLPLLALPVARVLQLAAAAFAGLPAGLRAGLVLLPFALLSAMHAVRFGGSKGIQSIGRLEDFIHAPRHDWAGAGRRLAELFPGGYAGGPLIAITAAGAVPYHSGLRTVDMLGLNDAWVARNGIPISDNAGHRTIAPAAYLLARDVNLVIGHPLTQPRDGIAGTLFCLEDFGLAGLGPTELLPGERAALGSARVLAMPVNAGFDLAMLALARHPAVEAAVTDGRLRVVQRGLAACPRRPAWG